jgi:hypothetical protein
MKTMMMSGALVFSLVACGVTNDNSAIKTCLANPDGSAGECLAPESIGNGDPTVGDIFTFDLLPTSDKNSLQAALFTGLKTLHEVDGGDTNIKIESIADGIYSVDDGKTMLLCLTQGGEYGCGFTMSSPDASPEANVLDLGTSSSDQSVQVAAFVSAMLYILPFGPDSTIGLTVTADADKSTSVFETSTAIMTSTTTIAPDELSISYGLKIELK